MLKFNYTVASANNESEAQRIIDNFKHYLDDSVELFLKKTRLNWNKRF